MIDNQRTIRRFHEVGVFLPFGLVFQSDDHNPTHTIGNIFARDLGLPDRNYFLGPEPRFQDSIMLLHYSCYSDEAHEPLNLVIRLCRSGHSALTSGSQSRQRVKPTS